MSLAGAASGLARRQGGLFEAIKALATRTLTGLASPLPSLAARSAAATPLPSLAALPLPPQAASSWTASTSLWSAGSALQRSLLAGLGGVRHASSSSLKPPFQVRNPLNTNPTTYFI